MTALHPDAFFMPFTAQRAFRKKPRIIAGAEGMHYIAEGGRRLLDAMAGLWCVTAGHNHPVIMEAIRKQTQAYDYTPGFMFASPVALEAAARLCALMPGDIDHVFFSNSGSEAVETAIKIAVAYQRARGKDTKTKIIGRARGYHGVNIGGMSAGGIPANRAAFGALLLPGFDHLPHTYDREQQAFTKGQPAWGAHLADALEDMVQKHGAEHIAAVIVEPVAGSAGVLPPPVGYLQKLRVLCDKHDILLIFDEVITGFGRMGRATGAEYFGVLPDMITAAKGINSGAVPMGATFMRSHIFDALMQGPEYAPEFMHGYTYSAHPLACASALGALDAYAGEGMFENAARLEPVFAEALHSLRDAPHVVDIRTIGLMGAVELAPGARDVPNAPSRAMEAFERLYWEEDMVGRFTGNTLAFSPALIVTEGQVGDIVARVRRVLGKVR